MDTKYQTAEDFVEALLGSEAINIPSDSVQPDNLTLELPEWFDEKKYNGGRRFFWENSYSFTVALLMGIPTVLSVPTMLRVTIATNRSSTEYTAYKRYLATTMHLLIWLQYDLKPGTIAWKSLHGVHQGHLRATMAGKLKGFGIVSQRDLALAQFTMFGFSMLKPDKFGIRQLRADDWENYNHFWRVIGYMVGIEDRCSC